MNLYFECNMGAAGDMISGALVDLFDDKNSIVKELNSLNLPHTQIKCSEKTQSSISGIHIDVIIDGDEERPDEEHHHHNYHGRNLSDINSIINYLAVDEKVKSDIINIYRLVAKAEAKAHNTEVDMVHFHELGMLDAVADITMCAYLINRLEVKKILSSPVNVGAGTVKCAHGVLPVPAPATANLLEGIPYYKSDIKTELCTPTGAAILKYFANDFTDVPVLDKVVKTGIGAGTKELSQANIIRAFLFESENSITELTCNIDDMTGEESGYALEKMISEGALDCFITPIIMKKSRPAYMLTVLCKNEDEEKFTRLIFKHTTTIGIRKYTPSRYTLERQFINESGVQIKRSTGFGVNRSKAEFEDIKTYAEENDISLFEAKGKLKNTDNKKHTDL